MISENKLMFYLEEDGIPEHANSVTSESDGRSDDWDPTNEALGVQFSEIFAKSSENIHLLFDLIEVPISLEEWNDYLQSYV